MEELKAKFKNARECLDSRVIPIDILQEFADYFEYLAEDPVSTIYEDASLKKFIFEEFIGGVAKRLSLLREISDEVRNIF